MARKKAKRGFSAKHKASVYRFDEQAAARAVAFVEEVCTHSKGEWAGRSFVLEDWQREIVRAVFGWKRADGTRRYRKVYVEVPRKNGKSTFGAALGLYCLFADDEPGAEIYSAAADRDQAAIIFDVARSMVENESELSSRADVYRRSIVYREAGSAYHVLSADVPTKHGKNSHAVVFDELHSQPNRDLFDVLNTSMGSRRQPLMLMFTTAGYDRESICWEIHEYALKVRDGTIEDETFLPVIYAADEDDDWTDPKVWEKANPNLGVSVKLEYLKEECARAKESPAYENTFRRLYLNQWTEQATRWIPMEEWRACDGRVDEAALVGAPCWAGLDLAATTDIAAFVLAFPEEETYRILARFWVPEDNIRKRARRDRVPYDVWAGQGLITATPGNVIDYNWIRRDINELASRFRIQEIGYDPWNATQLAIDLQDEDGFQMVEMRQGWKTFNEPMKETLRLILNRGLHHGHNPVLNWMASNMVAKSDPSGNLRPDKEKSTERIDGMVAMIMALGRAMVRQETGETRILTI